MVFLDLVTYSYREVGICLITVCIPDVQLFWCLPGIGWTIALMTVPAGCRRLRMFVKGCPSRQP